MHLLWLWIALAGAQEAEEVPADEVVEEAPLLRPDRLEFDERVVKGSTAAGSVYLFKRQPRSLPALVPVRRSWRTRIVEPVLLRKPAPPPTAPPVPPAPEPAPEDPKK